MSDVDIITIGGVAFLSSYLTLAVVGISEPTTNKYGEEEYTIPGYCLMAAATLIKWSIRITLVLFGGGKAEIVEKVAEQPPESTNEFQLHV